MQVTIKTKLLLSFGSVLLLLGAAGYCGVTSLAKSNESMATFAAQPVEQLHNIQALETKVMATRRLILAMLVYPDEKKQAAMLQDYERTWQGIDADLARYLTALPADRKGEAAELTPAIETYRETAGKGLAMVVASDKNPIETAITQTAPMADALAARIGALAARLPDSAAPARLAEASSDARLAVISAFGLDEPATRARANDALNAADGEFRAALASLAANPALSPSELSPLADGWSALFAAQRGEMDKALKDESEATLDYLNGTVIPKAKIVSDLVNARVDSALRLTGHYVEEANGRYDAMRSTLLALIGGAILIGAAAALWIAFSISRALSRSVAFARLIGEGDLSQTVEIRSRDEIGDLQHTMNEMTRKLREIVTGMRQSSTEVASGSRQSSQAAELLSQGASEQAAATEQASAAMEEMVANIRQTADNIRETETVATEASTNAERSRKAVADSVEAMREIAQKITQVEEIARQTDLLALNAAIEAARAGSHGKGFAVVASEVRKLAERAGHVAGEIGQLSSATLSVSQEAGQRLGELVPGIHKTAELVGEISVACQEQHLGAQQINQAIQQLEQVTQQNAGAAHEMSGTAEQLLAESRQLDERSAFFRLETAEGDETEQARSGTVLRVLPGGAAPEARHSGKAGGAAPREDADGFHRLSA
ncbi:methyl-accepting chemotaxis protein [Aureimonas sp. AU20]|uniref:HAMP domain-containing methyl-accepting chemotaxis protein n=1 Tax=Aureimonas sp. AU20 TaxID=1349819 RepID=UPI000721AAE6|nr:methyl-accepting chemotaxis protein [Aureimonas sp. AU20]ALN71605.1 hypothetical protein M673_02700 [Aureimonas sp. AU20]